MNEDQLNDDAPSRVPALGRRDLMKIGAGVVMTLGAAGCSSPDAAAAGQEGSAQPAAPAREAAREPREAPPYTKSGPGFRDTANRRSGNGPMDATMKRVVSFATSYDESKMTEATVAGINKLTIDTACAWIAGFGSEPGQYLARMARLYPAGEMKSTIAGWGVTTVPDHAAYANSFMVRDCDFNDGDPGRGGHASVIIPGILAIGEALHSTGPQVMAAIAIGYEFLRASRTARFAGRRPSQIGWGDAAECTATALACGKLLGLEEDRLANAVSLALVSQLALGKLDGTQAHFKAGHSAVAVGRGVNAALQAREGITGPNAPFEEKEGLFVEITGPITLNLPAVAGEMAVDNFRVKRYPIEGNAQAMMHQAVPPVRKFANWQDIESIHLEVDQGTLLEVCDPECWDPSNRETADHSLPYLMSVGLIDGEAYLDAFTPKRYLHDQNIRGLMARITCEANESLKGTQGKCRWTVKKKSGETMQHVVETEVPITVADVHAKFDRVCAFMKISNAERDRAKAVWANFKGVKDIAQAMALIAKIGPPLNLKERAMYASDVLA